MQDHKNYYITTAISYPNGAPHIGHAYEAIATDTIARYKRLDGYNVYFLTGTDEHGIKMLQTAKKEGISPRGLADKNTELFQKMVTSLNCSNDDFIRTTEPRHHEASQTIWRRMEDNGDIYLDAYAGWYSVRDEAYYDESELKESEDGSKLSPQGTPVEWVEEESYFFKLSKYQEPLLKLYEDHPEFIGPDSRRNEVINFVKGGLRDLSISRTTFDWGVKVPGNDKHVMYVWVDALTNYLTGLGFPDEETENYKSLWPADAHIIGKDIIRFHAIYWPAFLMSAKLPLPKRVFGHGFVLSKDGTKMGKTAGNAVDPFYLIETYGLDQFRYYLLREVSFGKDGFYSHEGIVNRTNADLANDLGNLASRSLSMIAKNCNNALPEPGDFTDEDTDILTAADEIINHVRIALDDMAIHRAIEATWSVVSEANKYFAAQEPWALKKTDPKRMETVLYVTAEVIRQVGVLALAVIPESANKLLDLFGLPEDQRNFAALGKAGRLKPGIEINKPSPVFPRFVEETEGD